MGAVAIRRIGSSDSAATFYVKGSFVLDVIFGTAFAGDMDVFYKGTRPTRDELEQWIAASNFRPPRKGFDIVGVERLDDASGAGYPRLNFERWHIRENGRLYTLQDTDVPTGNLLGPRYVTTVVALDIATASKTRAQFVPGAQPLDANLEGLEYARKCGEKINRHSSLYDYDVDTWLQSESARVSKMLADEGGDLEDDPDHPS